MGGRTVFGLHTITEKTESESIRCDGTSGYLASVRSCLCKGKGQVSMIHVRHDMRSWRGEDYCDDPTKSRHQVVLVLRLNLFWRTVPDLIFPSLPHFHTYTKGTKLWGREKITWKMLHLCLIYKQSNIKYTVVYFTHFLLLARRRSKHAHSKR